MATLGPQALTDQLSELGWIDTCTQYGAYGGSPFSIEIRAIVKPSSIAISDPLELRNDLYLQAELLIERIRSLGYMLLDSLAIEITGQIGHEGAEREITCQVRVRVDATNTGWLC